MKEKRHAAQALSILYPPINMMLQTKIISRHDALKRAVHKRCASHVDKHVDGVAMTSYGAIVGGLLNE